MTHDISNAPSNSSDAPTPRELRAELAREQILVYQIAPIVGLNPQRLGSMLNEKLPMPNDVARRVAAAIAGAKAVR